MQPPSSANILWTPAEVYKVAQHFFPQVDGKIEQEREGQMRLELQLSHNLSPVFLSHAVDSKRFSHELRELQVCHLSSIPTTLDPMRFSIRTKPFKDWQTFARLMYENQGGKCADVIFNYLNSSSPEESEKLLEELTRLGLARNQLSSPLTPEDLVYFRDVLKIIKQLNQCDIQNSLFTKFQSSYPEAFQQLLRECVDKQIAEYQKSRNFSYKDIKESLEKRVIGQEKAIKCMASALSTQQQANSNDSQVFLFVGPSGVGKTELAKASASLKDDRYIAIRMEQYSSKEDVSNLFGASIGYRGSTDRPHLAKEFDRYDPIKLEKNRLEEDESMDCYDLTNVVILFDEAEKAHPAVRKSLLSFLDEKYIDFKFIDNGKNCCDRYNLKNCIIIVTSNSFSSNVLEAFSQNQEPDKIKEMFEKLSKANRNQEEAFPPEFLGRTAFIPFGPIPKGDYYLKILGMKLNSFMDKLKRDHFFKEVIIENEEQILAFCEEKLYGDGTNLRKINDYLNNKILPLINESKDSFGDPRTTKITFFYNEEVKAPSISFDTFVQGYNLYWKVDIPIKNFP